MFQNVAFLFAKFWPFSDYVMLTWEEIPCFRTHDCIPECGGAWEWGYSMYTSLNWLVLY